MAAFIEHALFGIFVAAAFTWCAVMFAAWLRGRF